MKRDPDFDASADMRLIEMQRAALGVTPPSSTWHTDLGLENEPPYEEPPVVLRGATVVIDLTAAPSSDVIPGALVTFSLSAANDGPGAARNVRIGVPLPGGAAYRNGSFVQDGLPQLDDVADTFFGEGLLVESISPHARSTFVWKVSVRLGTSPLVVAPFAAASDAAVAGAQPVVISRRGGVASTFTGEVAAVELPFYELDAEEQLVQEAVDAALEPAVSAKPAPEPQTPGEQEIREAPAAVEPEPQPEEKPVREGVLLRGRIDRSSLAYFERLFSGSKLPTLLNHFMFGGALACTTLPNDPRNDSLKRHMEAQAQLLQRISLHERLGKKEPLAQYAGSMTFDPGELQPATISPAGASESNALTLQSEVSEPALAVLRGMWEERARWDFIKARQCALSLQAQEADGDPRTAFALRSYAQTASTQLQRFFVRMRVDRTTGSLFSNDETLDAAARSLIAALLQAFAA